MTSWIDAFVEHTHNLESPAIWRKWSAIGMIAATLEQKVWVDTGSILYPNLYVFLVGHPGTGKSRAITAAAKIIREALPEIFFGSNTMTRASLSDHMVEAKRFIPNLPHAPIEYNSLVCTPDEFSVFMSEYDTAIVSSLIEFYDVNPYSEGRRVANIRIKLERPQLNLLSGSTPSNLVHTLKDYVWDQGLMSRVIMVYASERPLVDVFNTPRSPPPVDLIHDIKIINTLQGEFGYTDPFAKAMHNWKLLGFQPTPDHPKLIHYATRRFAHLLKLCMVACVDRTSNLTLDVPDFNRAMHWLLEAEAVMSLVFQAGSTAPDSRIMDEVVHFIKTKPGAVPEHVIVNFLRERASSMAIQPILNAMQASNLIKAVVDNKGMRRFTAP